MISDYHVTWQFLWPGLRLLTCILPFAWYYHYLGKINWLSVTATWVDSSLETLCFLTCRLPFAWLCHYVKRQLELLLLLRNPHPFDSHSEFWWVLVHFSRHSIPKSILPFAIPPLFGNGNPQFEIFLALKSRHRIRIRNPKPPKIIQEDKIYSKENSQTIQHNPLF